jgi:hypothetical protein
MEITLASVDPLRCGRVFGAEQKKEAAHAETMHSFMMVVLSITIFPSNTFELQASILSDPLSACHAQGEWIKIPAEPGHRFRQPFSARN